MTKLFNTIGLVGRKRSSESIDTLKDLIKLLKAEKHQIILDSETASFTHIDYLTTYPREEFAKHCDLVIVVGGDGSILAGARAVVDHQKPVLGINRGRLGFLTDIHPNQIQDKVKEVLAGNYLQEKRFLLTVQIHRDKNVIFSDLALNDVVLMPGKIAHMIEFDIYINKQLVCSQRADGQIIATPTGSTAYALSGGGPILHPKLNAMALVPMFSHTLSARPIVIDADSHIEIIIDPENESPPNISCDGQDRVMIKPGDHLIIKKHAYDLMLLHPTDYNYYETLRTKLHWQTKL